MRSTVRVENWSLVVVARTLYWVLVAVALLVPASILIFDSPAAVIRGVSRDVAGDVVFRTIRFAVTTTAIQVAVGIPLGIALGMTVPFGTWRLVIVALPLVLPPLVVGLMSRLALDPHFGAVWTFSSLAIDPLGPDFALVALSLVYAWQWTPFVVLLMWLMTSQANPAIDRARLDGCAAQDVFWAVLWPRISATVAFILVFRFLDAMRHFDLIFIMTGGGPGTATETVSYQLFQQAFVFLDFSEAAVSSTMLLLVAMLIQVIAVIPSVIRRSPR